MDPQMTDQEFKPESLAQHFIPPDGYVGKFGWICGYSADAGFLNMAAERFVGEPDGVRAHAGRIALAVILDPSRDQLTTVSVPGVLHLPLRTEVPKRFRLMHAKVALLGYRAEDDEKWVLRLLVSTGNWTRETLEETLDVVWAVDVKSEELRARPDQDVRQACADIRAASDLFEFLLGHYDRSVLQAQRQDEGGANWRAWVKKASECAGSAKARFFDNRQRSLLDQLSEMVKSQASDTPRNYLALGSGFFEAPKNDVARPVVLDKIVDSLRVSGLLTSNAQIDIFVNPLACQAVAHSVSWMNEAGWNVRRAKPPPYFRDQQRSLHAKFIFGAKRQNNSVLCNSPWVYLGSGNLTGPGFERQMNAAYGNLEAGIVFNPGNLYWEEGRYIGDECVVTNLLPLHWDGESINSASELAAGEDMAPPEIKFLAAPIAYFCCVGVQDGGWLKPNSDAANVTVLWNGQECRREGEKGYRYDGPQPREVIVSWRDQDGMDRESFVPVIDENGRIAAAPLLKLDIEEAWGQLASFPTLPDEDDLPSEAGIPSGAGDGQMRGDSRTSDYPVRAMMQLIENIADKQTSIPKIDWGIWCNRLEQCLGQAAESKVLIYFREKLKLNPLSPLWHPPFRPDFAATSEHQESTIYEATLKRIEEKWQVTTLSKIEGHL